MDLQLSTEPRYTIRATPFTIHPSLTGKIFQWALLVISVLLFICGYIISRHDFQLSRTYHSHHRFNQQAGNVKYLYYSFAVLMLVWYFYDIYVYHPWHRRNLRRTAQLRTPKKSPRRPDPGPYDIRLPDLERNHPLVEGLRDLREGLLKKRGSGETPGTMTVKEFEEWQRREMADEWRDE